MHLKKGEIFGIWGKNKTLNCDRISVIFLISNPMKIDKEIISHLKSQKVVKL